MYTYIQSHFVQGVYTFSIQFHYFIGLHIQNLQVLQTTHIINEINKNENAIST